MKSWFPFSDYDFFGYLAVGGGVLLALDDAFAFGWLGKVSWTWLQIATFVGGAYAVGQVVAATSHRLVEVGLVRGLIGPPSAYLMEARRPDPAIAFLLPRFVKPLPEQVRQRIQSRATSLGIDGSGDALFIAAHSSVRDQPVVQERLSAFLGRYGLFRNYSIGALISAIAWFAQAAVMADNRFLFAGLMALTFAVLCVLRFLTFYRHFAQEVLTGFAFSQIGT